ncbi:TetR/AcrR family transcriptional regulator [Rhizobium sp. LEGMi198b]|uniref:TetR/AcrR family transcriptional regulator n=1 Tax=unclassified Rhizobium TaxID=2613769 RepID=UPI000CDF5206|nr:MULTISPECIES: TetR/AcrR family transcriptional regulator [Rhizobium]AVA22974.1 TetR family transcriptional regulator protein [Rhizobium sp. NXC24]MDK4741928.1 TetR/AcrR family transcriptional regulator [Rhizobium sp. CNPSo 3464]UWU20339.1 TetR/AcrR family transcriptional regulator [Rhizobium tropici]WFU01160.1 TetR/AcrR family transcriptional regulator [Rhizobium sp. CB3171]
MKHEPQNTAVLNAPASGGRWAAGEDPVKRQQILDGAKRVFMKMGFDAASMNDVTREAGVSKGTLYVYFANKEDLFAAMVDSERAHFVETVRTALADDTDVATNLYEFGMVFVTHVTSDKTISAMRTIIGVRERMPSLCQRFFTGPENLRTVLRGFLERQVAAGHLRIEDFDMAARHFLDMASGSYFKLRLFGDMDFPPSKEEIDYVVRGAVRVFMAAYGINRKDQA